MTIQFPILYERKKGPQTPNFRKLSGMLRDGTPTKIPIDRERVMLCHGGIGIKMIFVCDIMEKIQQLSGEIKTWRDGNFLYIKDKELFYDLIFNLDIFIFELYSVLDYLALEIAEILKSRVKKNKIKYFTDLKNALSLDPKIKLQVDNFQGQPWFKYFHKMRIRVVHMLPVNLMFLLYGKAVEFPFFPDDPRHVRSTCIQKYDPSTECKKWLEEVFDFIDNMCRDLGRELFGS